MGKLEEHVLSERNIFNAIYCLESYIFEKGLLDTEQPIYDEHDKLLYNNDLEMFYALADKHDFEHIREVIRLCKSKLKTIIGSPSELFETKVYFKAKGMDKEKEGEVTFRPMHTARLIDLICMVSMLNPLMFDDSDDKRRLSELSKLLPHNFFGNIPSLDVRYLFNPWQHMYRNYTREVIDHLRSYQNNHKYLTEVNLDIKNFFPSISPFYLYNKVVDKLSCTYRDEEDRETLKAIVAKLLFFKISKGNVDAWLDQYYPKGTTMPDDDYRMNCGIAQGLPQSYFFGNLCMIDIKKKMMMEECFSGEAYFYVDDSVIYVQAELKPEEFSKRITKLNQLVKEWCESVSKPSADIEGKITSKALDFQNSLCYNIQFHEEGKSTCCPIDMADNQLGGLETLGKETYIPLSIDEIDDNISLKKLEALDRVIVREIKVLKDKLNTNQNAENAKKIRDTSRLKLLRRFRKYFLYRNRRLKIQTEGGYDDSTFENFKRRFLTDRDREEWFENNEEDIFQSEYRLLIDKASEEKARKIVNEITAFERNLFLEGSDKREFLYYAKDISVSFLLKGLSRDPYKSLKLWAKKNSLGSKGVEITTRMEFFRRVLRGEYNDQIYIKLTDKNAFTGFVHLNSPDFQRKILNAFFSELIGVDISDALSFAKRRSRRMCYTELRTLAYLRNKYFDRNEFSQFIFNLKEKDISNQMDIDMGLLEVLGIFIGKVRVPQRVDDLIVTHRITKGLWYNGSKFLNSYTLHNEEHAVTLINKSIELLNRIDYFVLKDVDYYILFLSCYLHDVSMVIHPDLNEFSSLNDKSLALISETMQDMQKELDKYKHIDKADKNNSRLKSAGNFIIDVFNKVYTYFENEVRSRHANDSAKFIRDKSSSLLDYLSPTLLSFVATVSESHGWDVMEVYGLKSKAKDDTISLKYLMMLIRLADLLDVANNRVNFNLLRQNLYHLSEQSKFHWISHLVTDKLVLETDYDTDVPKERQESEKEKRLNEKPITETINFNLHLNVKYLTSMRSMGCPFCECTIKDNHIEVDIQSKNKNPIGKCENKICTFLCQWMMKKHEWLIQELIALNDYLFSVNTSLVSSNIRFNIYYDDDMNLDSDMFDHVYEFVEKDK